MAEGFFTQNSTLDGEVHFLKNPDDYISFVLCFPRLKCNQLESRLKTLLDDGFIYIVETGTRVLGRRIIGKGYTGVTTIALNTKYGLGALKILRLDSRRKSLEREAEINLQVQSTGLAPKVYLYRDFYIFREYIPAGICNPVTNLLESYLATGKLADVRSLITNILIGLHRLDSLGIDHTELGRPGGHLFYCVDGPKILDWDSARPSSKPSNLTSFVSFLLFRFRLANVLRNTLGYEQTQVLYSLKNYKETYASSAFKSVLSALKLEPLRSAGTS